MNDMIDSLITVSIPITATDRQRAAEFAAEQLTPAKATQVYRNTIAVLACDRYLQLLAIPSEIRKIQSWDRVDRWLKNVADLYLPELDKSLECRPISSSATHCFIPAEVQDHRIGYLVVQLDEPYREGIILGFVPQVCVTELPLSQIQPLDTLIDAYMRLAEIATLKQRQRVPINLSNWLKGKFEETWQPCLDILKPPKRPLLLMASLSMSDASTIEIEAVNHSVAQLYRQATLAEQTKIFPVDVDPVAALVHLMQITQKDEIRWQAAELLWEIDSSHPASPVVSARDVGMYLGGAAIALMVGVLPKSNHQQLILLRLYPFQTEPCLPKAVKLAIFDDMSNLLTEIESRERDQYIQFKFTADPGDLFEVRVSLNDTSIVEHFLV